MDCKISGDKIYLHFPKHHHRNVAPKLKYRNVYRKRIPTDFETFEIMDIDKDGEVVDLTPPPQIGQDFHSNTIFQFAWNCRRHNRSFYSHSYYGDNI